ncbi:hypothetical protein H7169_00405 [Candidatus Gracilibacteria bacterium]|nr:hypothetical protein [Candidatus Gracilibacteria bacterium]
MNSASNDTKTIRSSVDEQILGLEKNITGDPKNTANYIALSSFYFQRIRETADISLYEKITGLLDTAHTKLSSCSRVTRQDCLLSIGSHACEIIFRASILQALNCPIFGGASGSR